MTHLIPIWLAVACGGALGSVARYGVALAARRVIGPELPWGTGLVNIGGSLLIGLAWGTVLAKPETPEWLRIGFMTGVLGGFTTLSSLSLETVLFLESGAIVSALLHAAGNIVFGIVACAIGLQLARAAFAM